MGAFTKLFSRLRITSDPNVSTETCAVITADTTNANLVIAPNGTGGLIASIPDGTTTGGNARGDNAVDLQTRRFNANQVASGAYSTVLGGSENKATGALSVAGGWLNTASGERSVVPGGYQNTASGTQSAVGGGITNTAGGESSVVAGGQGSTASGLLSSILGGFSNVASSGYCVVSGGQSNTASTGTHATVVGGSGNTSSGQYSVSGGQSNTASGESAVALGRNNIASLTRGVSIGDNNNNSTSRGVAIGHDNVVTQAGGSFYAVAIGTSNSITAGSRNYVFGESCSISSNGLRNTAIGYGSSVGGSAINAMAINSATATANNSLGKGLFGVAYYYNGETRGGGIAFGGNIGTAQTTDLIAARLDILTTGGTAVLSLDGTGVTNLIIPTGTNRMWNVTIKYVAVVTTITGTATGVTVGDTKSQNIEIGFKKVGGVSSLVGGGSFSIPQEDASMSSASLIPTAGGSQELALTFTAPTFAGGGSVTCRVVAKVELVEVAY